MGIFSKLRRQKPVDDSKEEAKKAAAEEKEKNEGKKEEKKAEQAPKAKSKDKAAKKPSKGALAKEGGGHSASVLLEPVLTEKAGNLEALGQYTFLVAPTANKVEIAAAVRDLYGVRPLSIKIVNLKGKRVRFGRTRGQRKDRKKAIVSLRQGDAISLTE